MNSWTWLVGAIMAAIGAYLLGWPAWTAYQSRSRRDLNAERYLAWRGRADRGHAPERMTQAERRRIWVGAALALAALFGLVGFLSYR